MPVVDRLRALEVPPPDVDVDAALVQVRGRAQRHRRGRALIAAIVAVLVAAGGWTLAIGTDDADLDTVGPRGPIVRYLPSEVPEGFTMAWADERTGFGPHSDEPVPWHDYDYDYAYGYQSADLELEVLHVAGPPFDPDHVVIAWGEESEVSTDAEGRAVVLDHVRTPSRVIVQRRSGSILVIAHPLGEESIIGEGVVDADRLLAFARSMRPVAQPAWDAALSTADTTSPTTTFESEILIEGDAWSLFGSHSRFPREVTRPTFGLHRIGETPSPLVGPAIPMSHGGPEDEVTVTMDHAGEATVAWGLAPAGTATVRLVFAERTVETTPVAHGPGTVYAVEVGEVAGGPQVLQAVDEAGTVLAGVHDLTNGGRCVEAGTPVIETPDVVGMTLWSAVRAMREAGLEVVGTGTPPDDPIGPDATVTVQEPAAGERLPRGACVGFRTSAS